MRRMMLKWLIRALGLASVFSSGLVFGAVPATALPAALELVATVDSTATRPLSATVETNLPARRFVIFDVSMGDEDADLYEYSPVHTSPSTKYFRIDPATNTFVASDFAHTVVTNDRLRIVGSSSGTWVIASEIYNVDVSRAGSREIDVDFVTAANSGPATGPGISMGTMTWSFDCHIDWFWSIDGDFTLSDGLGNTMQGYLGGSSILQFGTFSVYVGLTGGTGVYAGATGTGWASFDAASCDQDAVARGRLTLGVRPAA